MSSSKPSDHSNSPKRKVTLDEIIDVTVGELFILNFLVRIAGNTVRFAVFNELNSHLTKDISRSSFYNSIKRLESKRFVEVSENTKGKGSLVKATPLAREALKRHNLISIWGNIDLYKMNVELLQRTLQEINLKDSDQILYISFDELVNIETIKYLDELVNETYLLVNEELREDLKQRGQEIPISRFEYGEIKERDGKFDQVVVFKYHPSANIFGEPASKLLAEAARSVSKDGYLILLSIDNLPTTDNMIINSIMADEFVDEFFKASSKESLEKDLENAGLNLVKFIEMRGYIITIAKKKS